MGKAVPTRLRTPAPGAGRPAGAARVPRLLRPPRFGRASLHVPVPLFGQGLDDHWMHGFSSVAGSL